MIAPARRFSCLSMPSCLILEQSNATGTSGSMEDLVVTLYLLGDAGALLVALGAANAPKPSSASETPARAMNRPTKVRRLKNADCEVEFFFMNGYGVDDLGLECEVSLLPKAPPRCQYLFQKKFRDPSLLARQNPRDSF